MIHFLSDSSDEELRCPGLKIQVSINLSQEISWNFISNVEFRTDVTLSQVFIRNTPVIGRVSDLWWDKKLSLEQLLKSFLYISCNVFTSTWQKHSSESAVIQSGHVTRRNENIAGNVQKSWKASWTNKEVYQKILRASYDHNFLTVVKPWSVRTF